VKLEAWLCNQPAKLQYTDLKTYILERFCLKPTERAQRILQLASIALGDQTISETWAEIQSLATLPQPVGGLPGKVSLKREILLQRLPHEIRHALPNATNMTMDDLVKEADQLLLACKATLHNIFSVNDV
jgi:hypothetical protein